MACGTYVVLSVTTATRRTGPPSTESSGFTAEEPTDRAPQRRLLLALGTQTSARTRMKGDTRLGPRLSSAARAPAPRAVRARPARPAQQRAAGATRDGAP